MANYGLKITKEGTSVSSGDLRLYSLTTQLDSLKIKETGSTTVTLSGSTIPAGGTATHTKVLNSHNLGYVPIFLPQATTVLTLQGAGFYPDYVLNTQLGFSSPAASGPGIGYELVTIYADDSKLYLKSVQHNDDSISMAWDTYEVTVYWTVFFNRLDETFSFS